VTELEIPAVVGLVGLGRMGAPICARLVSAGHRVVAGDIRPDRREAAANAGAEWAGATEAVAARADVLLTSLPGAPELREAIGPALDGLRPGSAWVDLTSATPAEAEELDARAADAGVDCADAPVGGGPDQAGTGELRLFAGGDSALLERVRPVLDALGQVEHVGRHGDGYTVKLLVNLLWFGQAVATGEALLLARARGLDLDAVRRALDASAAGGEFTRRDLPRLLEGDYLASFGVERCVEELRSVTGLAEEAGLPFALSHRVAAAYERALERYGAVDGELLAVALLEDEAGVRLRRS
jgi:3-hydroxyisobutyrate dehydrogenase